MPLGKLWNRDCQSFKDKYKKILIENVEEKLGKKKEESTT